MPVGTVIVGAVLVGYDASRTSVCDGCVIGPGIRGTVDAATVGAAVESCDGDVIGPSIERCALGAALIGALTVGDDTLGAVITDVVGAGSSTYGSIGCMTPEGPYGIAGPDDP